MDEHELGYIYSKESNLGKHSTVGVILSWSFSFLLTDVNRKIALPNTELAYDTQEQ